ncbi:MAG: hypothetical protein ACE5K8_05975 [Candidatus Zixiibacteriota bacterium]
MNRLKLSFCLLLFFCMFPAGGFTAKTTDLELDIGYIHPGGRAQLPQQSLEAPTNPPYHNGSTLLCAQCHVMHASQQHPHDDQPVPDPFGSFPQAFTPTPPLLKAFDPVALCLTCHDNVAGIPDVVGTDVNGLSSRSAGFFGEPGIDNARGHKLEYGLDTSPGFGLCMRCHFGGTFETASVSCIDCHNPHGNGRPRNLQWASDPGGEPQFGLLENPGAAGLARYETANVAYGTTNDVNLREVTNMCLDCHHVFTGQQYNDPDANGIHNRHPSYDSERGDPNNIAQGAADGTTDPAHWESGTGAGFLITGRIRFVNDGATDFAAATVVDAGINGVFCLSCHKAHGGNNAFGLLWDPVSGVNGEGCDQCHNKTAQ